MYCTSPEFIQKMQVYIDKIEESSNGTLTFAEYIPLPHFGNTILRFNIQKERVTLDDVDAFEAFMQDIVNDEFLVDFMGSVYQTVGLEPRMFEETFRKCCRKYSSIPIIVREYRDRLCKDAASLLNACGLPMDAKVWEIQIDDEISLFLLGAGNRKIGTYTVDANRIHVYETDEIPCTGLMRAIMYAKTQHVSLARILLEV